MYVVCALCVPCSSCSNVPRNKLYDSRSHISTIYLYLYIYVHIYLYLGAISVNIDIYSMWFYGTATAKNSNNNNDNHIATNGTSRCVCVICANVTHTPVTPCCLCMRVCCVCVWERKEIRERERQWEGGRKKQWEQAWTFRERLTHCTVVHMQWIPILHI